ncbi:MAG: hypothetical protein GWO16_02660 [Gammaproteobacteria bacterium]|nr:hypothetical protein [Gammaproteobacteria bacterium]NIR28568.1 hypothetical protein [Gammaproteobacteria bacterium]NIR97038.1 hypothetical protein [Gammaproteobacteria bacterium]
MPYFVYKVFDNRTLEPVDSFAGYREAKQRVRSLRRALAANADHTFRLIYARSSGEAERLLTQRREPRPSGEDS